MLFFLSIWEAYGSVLSFSVSVMMMGWQGLEYVCVCLCMYPYIVCVCICLCWWEWVGVGGGGGGGGVVVISYCDCFVHLLMCEWRSVCVCIFTLCMYTHTHTHAHTHIYIYMCVCAAIVGCHLCVCRKETSLMHVYRVLYRSFCVRVSVWGDRWFAGWMNSRPCKGCMLTGMLLLSVLG